MAKLQNFAYKRPLDPPAPPTVAPSPAQSSQDRIMAEEGRHPDTPFPRRVPLSDLISNTPIRGEAVQEVSPDDKVVWKLSPKKILDVPSASQERPSQQETIFLNLMENPLVVTVKVLIFSLLIGRRPV
jgi:hypothetical protein